VLVNHYVSYCNNFDHAIQTLDDCKEKSEKFRKFLDVFFFFFLFFFSTSSDLLSLLV
jgi:hypothetical protein